MTIRYINVRENEDIQHEANFIGEIPDGAYSMGKGFIINWQKGTVKENRHNGAFIDDVITTCIARLKDYQGTKFNNPDNEAALRCLNDALSYLTKRRNDRISRGVHDTHNI